ncbi:MAG: hypothetical protein KDI36_09765 [Pseudomonadales bacterium]|nr:hypothetical protein [Pseudomonadales bacterium]
MTSPYKLAKDHLQAGLAEASAANVTDAYGQALIWEILQFYKSQGRSKADITRELEFTLEELDEDGIFHVCRH